MSVSSVQVKLTMEAHTCGKCGGVYGLTAEFAQNCRDNARRSAWSCPYCRERWGYGGDTLLEQERKKAERLEARLKNECSSHQRTRGYLKETEARRRAQKSATTRLKKKAMDSKSIEGGAS